MTNIYRAFLETSHLIFDQNTNHPLEGIPDKSGKFAQVIFGLSFFHPFFHPFLLLSFCGF